MIFATVGRASLIKCRVEIITSYSRDQYLTKRNASMQIDTQCRTSCVCVTVSFNHNRKEKRKDDERGGSLRCQSTLGHH